MNTFPLVEWLSDWGRMGSNSREQREYVKREIARIAALGAAPMTQARAAPLEDQVRLAVSVLTTDTPIRDHRYYLRLVPGCTPPSRDSEGRAVPAGKLGKVLMAKVGTRGGQLPGSHNPATEIESAEFNADATKRREQLGRYNDNPIYANHLHVEIGFEPTLVSASEASLVLRDYGFGLKPQRYHNKSGRKVAEDGTVTFSDANRIDFWLVEEVPPSMIDRMGRVRDLKAEAEAAALEAATAPASAPEKHQQRRG